MLGFNCWKGGDEKEMNDGGVQAKLMANCQPLAVCVCVCVFMCVCWHIIHHDLQYLDKLLAVFLIKLCPE